jgi:hypothetical protein
MACGADRGCYSALLFVGTEVGLVLGTSTPASCPGWYAFQGATLQALLLAVELLLAQRVYVLYGRSRTMWRFLAGALLVENVVMLATLVRAVPTLQFNEYCIVTSSTTTAVLLCGSVLRLLGGWNRANAPPNSAAPIVFEALVLGLTLWKTLRGLRGPGRAPLLTLLLRDGTWAFLAVFGTRPSRPPRPAPMLTQGTVAFVLNAICYSVVRGAASAVLYAWLYAVLGIVGGRLVLNPHTTVRELGAGEDGTDMTAVGDTPGRLKGKGTERGMLSSAGTATAVSHADIELGLVHSPSSPAHPAPPSWYTATSAHRLSDVSSDSGSMHFATPVPPPKPSPRAGTPTSFDSALGEYEAYEPEPREGDAADVFGLGRMW